MGKLKINKLCIFAFAAHGIGLSGGDRIFIELARRWSKKVPIDIYVWDEGAQMLSSQHLKISNVQDSNANGKEQTKDVRVNISKIPKWSTKLFIVNYLLRVIEGVRLGLSLKLENDSNTFIYNASEFWMDSFPCAILKIRFPKIKWIATWYQTAPNPLRGYKENGKRDSSYNFSALLYWLVQLPVKPLINKYADKVIVNNEDERKRYPEHQKKGNVIVLIGAVPLREIENWKKKNKNLMKVYDGVFQGRFHPQKGVIEAIEIWKRVVDKKPNAKLAMIGDGSLMPNVRNKIKDLGISSNVKLLGYVFDGDKKYRTFASSKVVIHPALYDSGGMASAEAMAFGLPCVGFNLKAYESYYPKGMIKVPIGDKHKFAKEILKLLKDKSYYRKIAVDARSMIEANWSWEVRSEEIYNNIIKP